MGPMTRKFKARPRDSFQEEVPSFFLSNSFTCCGLALPWVAFITWPTKKANSLSLPER